MTYSDAAHDAAVNGVRALLTSNLGYVSTHTADPGNTGASEATGTTYARGPSTFPTATGGAGSTGSAAAVTQRTSASSHLTHWGLWTAVTGGTWVTGGPLPVAEDYSTAGGTYTFTPTLTATG